MVNKYLMNSKFKDKFLSPPKKLFILINYNPSQYITRFLPTTKKANDKKKVQDTVILGNRY